MVFNTGFFNGSLTVLNWRKEEIRRESNVEVVNFFSKETSIL